MIMRKKNHIQHASNDWKSIQVKKGVSHSEDIKVVIATSNHIVIWLIKLKNAIFVLYLTLTVKCYTNVMLKLY